MNPKISVILPVYNAELYLKEAIESILNQTYTDFELLIYNDGSIDKSAEIIDSFGDSRIRVFYLEKNIGLINVLNKALKNVNGDFIARMDADDISLPERFQKQIDFLESNPEYGICGTQLKILNSDTELKRPSEDAELRWWIFKGSPLAHPTVMIRTSVITENNLEFNKDAYVAEDYDLWWRMAFYCKMANLNETYLLYRIHPQQESSAKTKSQSMNHRLSLLEFIKCLGIDSNRYDTEYINDLLSNQLNSTFTTIIKTHDFFNVLRQSMSAVNFFSIESINHQEQIRLEYLFDNCEYYQPSLLKFLFYKPNENKLIQGFMNRIRFVLKCLMRWQTR